jgi:predicted Rossmann fold nucleotide-binding protein DprA/Smf involved in DNA uptake
LDIAALQLNKYITQIVSGGQTGVDRAALDWAIQQAISHAGWCPANRRAEDGIIADHYHLKTLKSGGYRQRTRKNAADSDGTLILNWGKLEGGSLKTQHFAESFNQPCLLVQLDADWDENKRLQVLNWLVQHKIQQLNIAGPRESKRPGIYSKAFEFLNFLNQVA